MSGYDDVADRWDAPTRRERVRLDRCTGDYCGGYDCARCYGPEAAAAYLREQAEEESDDAE